MDECLKESVRIWFFIMQQCTSREGSPIPNPKAQQTVSCHETPAPPSGWHWDAFMMIYTQTETLQLHQISLNSDWNLQTIACLSHYLSLCAQLFLFFGMSKPVCLGCLWSRVHASLSVDCLCSISQSISQHVELMWQSFNVPADQTATEIKNNKVIALPIQLGREPESSVELQLSCIWFSSPCSPLH